MLGRVNVGGGGGNFPKIKQIYNLNHTESGTFAGSNKYYTFYIPFECDDWSKCAFMWGRTSYASGDESNYSRLNNVTYDETNKRFVVRLYMYGSGSFNAPPINIQVIEFEGDNIKVVRGTCNRSTTFTDLGTDKIFLIANKWSARCFGDYSNFQGDFTTKLTRTSISTSYTGTGDVIPLNMQYNIVCDMS